MQQSNRRVRISVKAWKSISWCRATRSRSEYELPHLLVLKTWKKNKREQTKNTLPLFSGFVSLRSAASVFSVSPYKHYFYRTACTLCGLRGCLPTFKRQSKQLFLPFPIAQILSARWISSVGLKHISKLKRRLPLARLAVVTVNRFSVGRIVLL